MVHIASNGIYHPSRYLFGICVYIISVSFTRDRSKVLCVAIVTSWSLKVL